MDGTSPRVRALLRQAQRTEESGKRSAAEQLYRQIVDEEPQVVEAWLGLARVSGQEEQREKALERVLAIDPHNAAARALRPDGSQTATPDADGVAPQPAEAETDEDPFSLSRSWLEEATARQGRSAPRAAAQGGATSRAKADETAPAGARAMAEAAPVVEGEAAALEDAVTLYCYRHPNRETGLRCITCNRPICTKCARHTPVGYRCPRCIREAQDVFFSANVLDYAVAALVTLVLSLLAGLIAPRLGFFVIFIGPAAGTLIGRAAFRVARRRHGRYLAPMVAALVATGGLLPTALPLLAALLVGAASLGGLGFGLLWPLLYVFLATGSAYYQVK